MSVKSAKFREVEHGSTDMENMDNFNEEDEESGVLVIE